MKKLLSLLLTMLLLLTAASAEFDYYALKELDDHLVYTMPGTANTVVRALTPPYEGTLGEDELIAYLDYVILPDEEVTTFRLCLSVSLFDAIQADSVIVTVDKKQYTFTDVMLEATEYDGIYMEDYSLILSDVSYPIVTALAKGKSSVTLDVVFENALDGVSRGGSVTIVSSDVTAMVEQYNELGGKEQDLSVLAEKYPCTVEKVR